ncbi:MAG: ATP synthase subunit C [Brevinematia bacterium]
MIGLILFGVIIVSLVIYFFMLVKTIILKDKARLKRVVIFGSVVLVLSLIFTFALAGNVFAQDSESGHQGSKDSIGLGLRYIGAALAVGLAAIGAGIAVGPIGVSAISVISEKPEMFGTSLIFIGLAEGIAIYGIAIAVLIMFAV